MHAGGLACGDFQKFGFYYFLCDDRLDCLGDFVHGEAERVRNHGDGFRQAVMLDHSGGNLRAKFFDGHARADFFLQRHAALAGVHDAHAISRDRCAAKRRKA